MEPNKNKDKTEYIKGSLVLIEYYERYDKKQGEWSNKKKPFRIRIIYLDDPKEKITEINLKDKRYKKKIKQFFLYFDDENKMKEVYIMIFGLSLTTEKKQYIRLNLGKLNTKLIKENKFYILLKILAVKNKIKKRKLIYNKIENAIKEQIDDKYFEKLFEMQYSDYLPLISNVSSTCGSKSYKNEKKENKKSLNDLITKYKSLKDEIPFEVINNENNNKLSNDGTSFVIPNGVQIEKNKEDIKNFKLAEGVCNNAKYIYFNKKKT